jgi:2'-5' RNA ligase
VARDNLHLTLCFLGDVAAPHIATLRSQLDAVEQPAFELQLQTPGYFKRPRIVWLGLKQPEPALARLVTQLNKIVSDVLPGYTNPQNSFIAHVSLFRHAAGIPGCEVPDVIRWPVTDFALVESINQPGAVAYRVLQRWPLA